MPFSTPNYNEYTQPRPFALPTVWLKPIDLFGFFLQSIDRETLYYSSNILEECMYYITQEFVNRGRAKPIWKIYHNSTDNYSTFTNPQKVGTRYQGTPVKWFPQYIKDIQEKIEELIADSSVPDSLSAYLARVFCNSVGRRGSFTNINKLKNNIYTPNGTLNPLTRAQVGLWPFEPAYVDGVITWIGIGPKGDSRMTAYDGSNATIKTTDPNWPRSVIGESSGTLVDGIDIPMNQDRRPDFSDYPRENADGTVDYDQGYGYFGHLPFVVQMCRYQPPLVETFPTNIAPRHYVSAIYSNTTPNLNWYLAQPVTTGVKQNWGTWLIQGYAGFQNGLYLRIYDDPSTQEGEEGNCPYPWLFPPPYADCSCGYVTTASAVWWSSDFIGFKWEGNVYATDIVKSRQKYFSPHCHLRINEMSFAANGGENVVQESLEIYVQTAKVGTNPTVPSWVKIIDMDAAGNDLTGTEEGIVSMSTTSIDVRLQDRLRAITGWYPLGGADALLAVWIRIRAETNAEWTCQAVDGPDGRFLPNSCNDVQTCTAPEVIFTAKHFWLDEYKINGDPVLDYPNV